MNPRMARMFLLAILLVTLSESLILHWTGLAFGGGGFDWAAFSLVIFAIGALNIVLFPVARSRIHAKGLGLVLSRVWILGSVAALLTGMMLATVFALLYSGGWIFAAEDARDIGILWLGDSWSRLDSVPACGAPQSEIIACASIRFRFRCPTFQASSRTSS